jgi:cytosine/adenosine deaminase-related metal-dependent hydrolase
LDLDGLTVWPGLINAHDHLELDLLPRVGTPPYQNSYQWLDDLARHPPAAAAALAVSQGDRIRWGALRNLLSGVTTVAQHGPLPLPFFLASCLPIQLRMPFSWSESLRAGPDVAKRARHARGRMPFAIHLADGIDSMAAGELDALDSLGALGPGTLLVHGVALDPGAGPRLASAKAALAWCPRTSHFLFGASAPVKRLRGHIPIALATDSTMTGSTTLFDEIRFAASTAQVDPDDLLRMVTSDAARALLLADRGKIEEGAAADLIALPIHSAPEEAILKATPSSLALVVVAGHVRLAAKRFANTGDLEPISVEGQRLFITRGTRALVTRIRRAMPPDFASSTLALVTE